MKKLILLLIAVSSLGVAEDFGYYNYVPTKGDIIAKVGIEMAGGNDISYTESSIQKKSLDVLFGLNGQFEYLHPVYNNDRFHIKTGAGLNANVLGTFSKENNEKLKVFGTYEVYPYFAAKLEYDINYSLSLNLGSRLGIGYIRHHNSNAAGLNLDLFLGATYNKIIIEGSAGISWAINKGAPYYNGKLMVGYELNQW